MCERRAGGGVDVDFSELAGCRLTYDVPVGVWVRGGVCV